MKISRKDIIAKIRSNPHCRKFTIDLAGEEATLLVRHIPHENEWEFKPELIEIASHESIIKSFVLNKEVLTKEVDPWIPECCLLEPATQYENLTIIQTTFKGIECYSLWHSFQVSASTKRIFKPVYLLWEPEFLQISNAMQKLEILLEVA